MAKPDFKQLLLAKGEKIGLGIAGGVMLLLFVIGIINLFDIPDSGAVEFPKKIGDKTKQIQGTINGPGEEPKEPLASLKKNWSYPFEAVARDLATPRTVFNPVGTPDDRRTNPTVLGMSEIYATPILAKIEAYDIVDIGGTPHIAVLEHKDQKKDENQRDQLSNALRDIIKLQPPKKKTAPATNPQIPGKGPNGQPVPGQPTPPNPGTRPGAPVMPGSTPNLPGGRPTLGGQRPPMPPSATRPGKTSGSDEPGQRDVVKYVEIDDKKLEGHRFAFTLYPKRLVVLQASFPYKAQLEEIQKALRLDRLSDLVSTPDAMPVFQGVIVQRRLIARDGKPTDWEEFDYQESYKAVHSRKLGVKDEDPKLASVLLHSDHRLVVPLPELLNGTYPDPATPADPAKPDPKTFLPTIKDTLAAFASKKPVPPAPPPSRFKGEDSIFSGTGKTNDAVMRGQPKLAADAGKDGFRFPTMKRPETGTGAGIDSKDAFDPPDHILVRIIDADVEPGIGYEYRMQVRMVNPNWVGPKDPNDKVEKPQKYELMSRPTDADVEILPKENLDAEQRAGKKSIMAPTANRWDENIWNRAPVAQVSFPQESFFYATEPPATDPKEKKNPHELKPGQAMLQFQRWMPFVKLNTFDEPVGDWVVADVVVTRGQLVGGKQFVNLPLWSSEFNRYILREVQETKVRSKEAPKRGVVMDPASSMPTMLCVEVEGGKQSPKIGGKFRDDESAYEILLMTEDGQLRVHDSFVERQNPQRKARETMWTEWINKIDKATDELVPRAKDTGPKVPGKFD